MKLPNYFRVLALIVFSTYVCIGMTSCITAKKLKYFRDLPDSTQIFLPPVSFEERVVEYGDQLAINITAAEKDAVAYFNAGVAAAPGGPEGAQRGDVGYLVDPLGKIEFPILGKVDVLGLTARQLKEKLTELLSKYIKDPLVDVRFNTFQVTVLGEVRSPGTRTLPLQRTTIFEALAAAGDLPQTAKRYDIHLYRDYNGERTITKIDLRKKDILYNAETFQMRHNDVIYVQPYRSTIAREDIAFYTSFFSILASLVSVFLAVNYNN